MQKENYIEKLKDIIRNNDTVMIYLSEKLNIQNIDNYSIPEIVYLLTMSVENLCIANELLEMKNKKKEK